MLSVRVEGNRDWAIKQGVLRLTRVLEWNQVSLLLSWKSKLVLHTRS